MKREDFIEQVKACGQSIIDNAEKIYNSFEFPTNGLMIEIEISRDIVPTITVVQKFLPEGFVKSIK